MDGSLWTPTNRVPEVLRSAAAAVYTRGQLQLVFSWVCKALGEGVKTQIFSRGEGSPQSPPTLQSSWDRRRPRGGQGRSGGPRAQAADLRALSTLGGCGREARPQPPDEQSSGRDAEGSAHWPSPRTPELSTRSEARPQKPHVRAAAQEASCPGVGVWMQFTRDTSLAWPSGPSEQGAGRPATKAGSGSVAGTVAHDPVPT